MKTARPTFHLRMDKLNPETGEAPIYCRITVDGKRSNFSINRTVAPDRWKHTDKLQKARKQEDRELAFYMDSIKAKIKEIERQLIDSKIPITADNVRNAWTGKDIKSKSLIEAFEFHNENFEALVKAGENSKGTLDRYKQVLKHLKSFLKYQYNKTDMLLDELQFNFITNFDHYFRTVKKCNNNSTVKYIRNFRKIIKRAVDEGWLEYDLFAKYKGKVKETTPEYLTPDEIKIIEKKNIPIERLAVVRDIFLFAIYTGYAYGDVKKLTYDELQHHIDGKLWIFTERKKTGVKEDVMMLHPAMKLINKYRSHPVCMENGVLLPVLSNQKMNAYLKELADICGLRKNLTFHMARHSFATSIMLANGAPIETVSATIGHKSIKQTQHYAKILNTKISDDMKLVDEKLKARDDDHFESGLSVVS